MLPIRNVLLVTLLCTLLASGYSFEHETGRLLRNKRGASVYRTFPSPHGITKDPQDFIRAIGAGSNGHGGGGGYGGSALASQFQQSGYAQSSYGGGGGGYGRKRRSTAQFSNAYYEAFNPYASQGNQATQNFGHGVPETSESDASDLVSYSAPSDQSLYRPNPLSVVGLLKSATSSYNAQTEVFKALTARTPLFIQNSDYY